MMRDRKAQPVRKPVTFERPPAAACWLHQGLRSGFEVAYFSAVPTGLHVEGTTTGFQDGDAWVVAYEVDLDDVWKTRRAVVATRTQTGSRQQLIECDGEGHWRIDGEPAPGLDGCRDVDLEASALTNTFPVHRLSLAVGQREQAPAAYVGLTGPVTRLDQRYERRKDQTGLQSYDYAAPAFDFTNRLLYDRFGLVVDYPAIATRIG